nr:hypothetical protein [Tanacetum cinerariifolium]
MSNTNNNLQTQTSNALYNAILEAGAKDRSPILASGNYVKWKSRIKRYIDTKLNNELIHYCLQNPPYKFKWTEKTVPVTEGVKGYILSTSMKICRFLISQNKAIERLKQGESINVQDLEINFYWEFRKFTSRDGESLKSYYSRFYKMVNKLVKNQCDVTNHQVNVQFLLQLHIERQRFVTLVKQSQELKTRCTCKSCGKGAYYGYNCPPKVPITSNLEPCHDQNVEEFLQTLPSSHPTCYSGDENSFAYDSTPNLVKDSPNVFNPPSQPSMYSYEFRGDDAHYSYYCPPQVSFIYDPEPCYNQDFNFP